jgi:multimeric flavodoxin WrbA
MKVVAINGSPHAEAGNTEMILKPFLDGMKKAGAEVEVFYTRKLKINPCNGDYSCWFKNPGVCGQKDDMPMLLPKIKDADIIVFASPVYFAGITGPLKNLLDRLLPMHPMARPSTKKQKMVLLSVCGTWEINMFDPLIAQMKAISSISGSSLEFVASILRPHADIMADLMKTPAKESVEKVLDSAREAGDSLVRTGAIQGELQRAVSAPLISLEEYNKGAEEMFEAAKAAGLGK